MFCLIYFRIYKAFLANDRHFALYHAALYHTSISSMLFAQNKMDHLPMRGVPMAVAGSVSETMMRKTEYPSSRVILKDTLSPLSGGR